MPLVLSISIENIRFVNNRVNRKNTGIFLIFLNVMVPYMPKVYKFFYIILPSVKRAYSSYVQKTVCKIEIKKRELQQHQIIFQTDTVQ